MPNFCRKTSKGNNLIMKAYEEGRLTCEDGLQTIILGIIPCKLGASFSCLNNACDRLSTIKAIYNTGDKFSEDFYF